MIRNWRKKKIYKIVIAVVLFVIICFSIFVILEIITSRSNTEGNITTGDNIDINVERIPPQHDNLQWSFYPAHEEYLMDINVGLGDNYLHSGGMALGAWARDEDHPEYGIREENGRITLNSPQDVINVYVGNFINVDRNFILKIFYNYEEIEFNVLGSEVYDSEFLFMLEGGYEVNIPIRLSESLEATESISKLTVGVFMAPERFSMKEEALFGPDNLGMVLNFEINYGFEGDLILNIDSEEPLKTIANATGISGLGFNKDFDPPGHTIYVPPNPLQVSPGEEIELGFVTNASSFIPETVMDYLIITMIDWRQTSMNGNPYLLINTTDDEYIGDHGRFFITAPENVGKYEVMGFLISNPTNLNSEDNFWPLIQSIRFTIEVVE